MELVPSLEPRNLDSIRYIVSAVTNHERLTYEELKTFVTNSNYEFFDTYKLLQKCEIIDTGDDYVRLNLSEIEFTDVYREVLLESCRYNRSLRKSALQIGINRSGNYIRRENVDQLLRNSNLYDSDSNQVTYWWFQLKELDRENSTSVGHGNPHTGFYGERLTIDYEKRRLNSRSQIEWVSLLPNGDKFGYDIKSVRQQNAEKLLIEVKSSKSDFLNAKVYLTRNEYKTMLRNLQNYVLYLWWNVEENTGQGPLLVEGSMLAEKLSSLEKNGIEFNDSLIIPFTVLGGEME